MTDPGSARAWGWLAHLRDGGATPWAEWAARAEPTGARLPGVQQLELLRRLNLTGRPDPSLVARVLAADPPRRSRPSLPLAGVAEVADHGPRPADPGEVSVEELVELLAVVVAGDLAAVRPPPPPVGRVRPWAVRYHLHGDPEQARAVGRHLVAHGRRPATHGGRALVIGADAGQMMVDLWTHRALGEGVVPWREWWQRRTRADRLPGPVDLERGVASGHARPGLRALHLVTDLNLAPRLVGLRRPLPGPAPLAAGAVDLGRRVVGALRPLVEPDTRRALVSEVLRPRLATVPGQPLVVPPAHLAWLEDQATRLITRLDHDRDRYRVHGDLEELRPIDRPGTATVRPRDTLVAGIGLLLSGSPPRPGIEEES